MKHIKLETKAQCGFTLIEMMIAVVIASILVAIAVPSYTAQIKKSRRTEAKTTLLDLAGREERYFNANVNSGYTNLAANLGYTSGTPTLTNLPVGSGYYTVTVTVGAQAPPTSYTITATAVGTQTSDTDCLTFTLDQTGKQTATSSTCWN